MMSSKFKSFFVLVLLFGLLTVTCSASTGGGPVEVSEVAWSGTRANWADEWIELRNISDQTVDLTGWTLSWNGVTVNLGKEKGNTLKVEDRTIKPGEAFLLERSDDKAVKSVKADVIYKGSLANSGERLVLTNPGGEEIQVIDGSEGWMAGTTSSGDPGYASMQLVDGKWTTVKSEGSRKDLEGNLIYGTPGKLPEE